ncbi:MAG: 50S ribosomal protein L10 [Clostridia bacterium]|nr:50S ribosomal protein L10 [Clostridia bacterium]
MSKEAINAKKKIVEEIKQKISDSKSVVFVNYQGINVEQDTRLRKSFREKNVDYKIYKNRLIKIALDELGIKDYDAKNLEGVTSCAFAKDEVNAANVLFGSKKTMPMLDAKFGILGKEVVNAQKVEALSKIPPKEILIAMLLSMLNAPVTKLARTLDAVAKKNA